MDEEKTVNVYWKVNAVWLCLAMLSLDGILFSSSFFFFFGSSVEGTSG